MVTKWVGKLESGLGFAVYHDWGLEIEFEADFLVMVWFFVLQRLISSDRLLSRWMRRFCAWSLRVRCLAMGH